MPVKDPGSKPDLLTGNTIPVAKNNHLPNAKPSIPTAGNIAIPLSRLPSILTGGTLSSGGEGFIGPAIPLFLFLVSLYDTLRLIP